MQNHIKPQVIILQGVTGSGKSTVLEFMRETYEKDIQVGRKLTNRPQRVGDNNWEFTFLTSKLLPGKYTFHSVNNWYAVDELELMQSITSGKAYAITLTDRPTLEVLKERYSVLIIFVYRNMARCEFGTLLNERGENNSLTIQNRLLEYDQLPALYHQGIDLYHHVILNISTLQNLYDQVRTILRMYGFGEN